jgi:hypothetical protein
MIGIRTMDFRRDLKILFLIVALASVFGFAEPWFFAKTAQASIPTTLGYQGRLKNASGTALTGTYTFTFRLYATSTGGTALWTEIQSVSVDQSFFSVQLGSVTPFPASVDFNQPLFISTQVNPDGEMTPRVPINSVAYAYTAGGVSAYLSPPISATGGRMYYMRQTARFIITTAWLQHGRCLAVRRLHSNPSPTQATSRPTPSNSRAAPAQASSWLAAVGSRSLDNRICRMSAALMQTFTNLAITGSAPSDFSNLIWTNATGTNTTSTNLFARPRGSASTWPRAPRYMPSPAPSIP